jgi:polyisoprenoid-binding protein YceI
VVLDVVLNGTIVHPMSKKQMAGFKITGIIKRSDFGIGSSFPAPMLSDEVMLTANTEFSKD